jgi:fermentation-respiration switch protein FrsA (DUF1100 family)
MRRDIDFSSEGVTVRGWLYMPAQSTRAAATIVMAHGFSAVKEMRLDRFAEAFAAAGLVSLVFDYRGFGASDGTPRQDIDPAAQVTDYRNAISFARQLPEVDGIRIGIWGSSYSGAHVLTVAALDKRVKAAVAQVPMIDGWETFERLAGSDGLTQLVTQLIAERERVYAGGPPAMIPVVTNSGEFAALTSSDSWEWFQARAHDAPNWRNEVTLRSLDRLLDYAPGRFIDRIAPTPLLILAAQEDFLPLDIAQRAFERAGEPKRLVVLPGGHFDPYEEPHFATAAREATQWFTRYL